MIPKAKRVQRPRRKGAPVPAGSKWVGRGSPWANPFFGRQWGHADIYLDLVRLHADYERCAA